MARILAKSLNCVNGPTDSPCGICNNCKEITSSTSPDVIEIDGASNTGVDDVRDLQKELFYAPSQSQFKIYIIDEVHMLSKSAFNALLKTLEEPPENVIFVFATTEVHKVLPTIISRCQRFDFRRIPVEDIKERLREISLLESIKIDDESLYLIARKSDGGMRDALSLLDQVLSFADGEIKINLVQDVFGELPLVVYANIMTSIINKDSFSLIESYQDVINRGIDLNEFLNGFMEFVRKLVMQKVGVSLKGLVEDEINTIKEISTAINNNNLLYITTLLIQLKQDIRTSTHPSMMIEVMLIKMTQIDTMEDLGKILERLEKSPTTLSSIPTSVKEPISRVLEQKPIFTEKKIDDSVELEYIPPKKVKELSKEHVIKHWSAFLKKVKAVSSFLSIYLKEEYIVSVKSDIIFMEIDSQTGHKMIFENTPTLNELLSTFFDLPVKLMASYKEIKPEQSKKLPSLQEIEKENPELAKLIEMTDSLIVPK
jgi:DNA polymerase-3 subunit gamma/tau